MATIFEKIIAGEIPATIVHKDDRVTAFRDISPQAPVHVLIVPNKPIPTVNDVADDDERMLGHMFVVARDIAQREGIAGNGFRLIVNCNKHGGQVVYQLVEWIKGSPLSERAQVLGQQLGLGLLAALMGVALFNDILRQFG